MSNLLHSKKTWIQILSTHIKAACAPVTSMAWEADSTPSGCRRNSRFTDTLSFKGIRQRETCFWHVWQYTYLHTYVNIHYTHTNNIKIWLVTSCLMLCKLSSNFHSWSLKTLGYLLPLLDLPPSPVLTRFSSSLIISAALSPIEMFYTHSFFMEPSTHLFQWLWGFQL